MKIRYLGHSCFMLVSQAGTAVVTDPYGDIGYPLPHVHADAVTVSHGHYDHANVAGVDAAAVFCRAGEFAVGDFRIRAIPSDHDDAGGRLRGKNLIFTFQADGVTVTHLGDLGEPFSEARARTIPQSDALLIPVGGRYTIDALTAAQYIGRLRPAAVIPMHYKTEDLNIDIAGPDAFLGALAGKYPVEAVQGAYTPAGGENTKIIILQREKI